MGGRGSSFGVEIISAVSPYGSQDAEIQELNVAGELIYVRVLNALKRLKRQRHLSDPLVLVYQNKYMRSLKRR